MNMKRKKIFSSDFYHMFKNLLLSAVLILGFNCCETTPSQTGDKPGAYDSDQFKSYWYSGKAEINSYKLKQSRYGEIREGNSMLIFVTEDFSRNKQVKLDGQGGDDDKIGVLKLNFTKNFVTGIYPYSMMLSVFTPIHRNAAHHTLKEAMSSQEWCGQVYAQLNLRGEKFEYIGHSYFEKEGEGRSYLKAALLEDEIWNAIRLDDASLPIGEVDIIPGLFFTRLRHTDMIVMKARISKNDKGNEMEYVVEVPEQEKKVVVRYEKAFPHKILGWTEWFKERGQEMVTSAILDKSIQLDYWKRNSNEFKYLRDSLGLSPTNY
jgi:hypothetical protein